MSTLSEVPIITVRLGPGTLVALIVGMDWIILGIIRIADLYIILAAMGSRPRPVGVLGVDLDVVVVRTWRLGLVIVVLGVVVLRLGILGNRNRLLDNRIGSRGLLSRLGGRNLLFGFGWRCLVRLRDRGVGPRRLLCRGLGVSRLGFG